MSIASQIKQAALEIANEIVQRAQQLKPELAKIEERKAVIEAQLKEAHFALDRAKNFQPMLGADFYCPRCGVANEVRSKLTPIPNDILRCHRCNLDLQLFG